MNESCVTITYSSISKRTEQCIVEYAKVLSSTRFYILNLKQMVRD